MSVMKPQIKEALRKQPNEWLLKLVVFIIIRSEERRVWKEFRNRWWAVD